MSLAIFLSRALFLLCRFCFRMLVGLKMRREHKKGLAPSWKGYSQLLEENPLFFHFSMFNAPRWNCHAALGVLRGLEVKGWLAIRLKTAQDAARAWSIMLYSQGSGNRTEHAIGPDQPLDREGYCQLELTPGCYNLGVRYYEPQANASWPEVLLDGKPIPAQLLGDEWERYQAQLKAMSRRAKGFYRLVHFHIIAALKRSSGNQRMGPGESAQSGGRLARWLLPVGNPQTAYQFGYLPRGKRLKLTRREGEQSLCYLTILDAASLPRYFTKLEEALITPAFPQAGLYLIRIQALAGQQLNQHASVACTVTDE